MAALAILAVSCKEKPEPDPTPVEPKSSDCALKDISAWAESVDREKDVLDIDLSTDGKTITLIAPETYDNEAPVDPAKVHVNAKAASTATVSISENDVLDLSSNKNFTITAEDGTVATYTLVFQQTEQKKYIPDISFTASELWNTAGADLKRTNSSLYATGIAVNDEYVFMLDGWILDACKVNVYNKTTGAFVKAIENYVGANATSTETCVIAMDTDDAGNIVTGKFNWNQGIGCRVDYWTGIDAAPGYAMHIDQPGCSPTELALDLGRNMTVCGDITKDAYVIYTTGGWGGFEPKTATYAVCHIVNGEIDGAPEYFSAYDGTWSNAIVQRASMDDATLYIGYCDKDVEPAPDEADVPNYTHFSIATPGKPMINMNQACFHARLLDMKVFRAGDLLLLATLEQNWAANSEMFTRVYNITNTDTLADMTPESENYSDVLVFEYEWGARTNNGRYGRVDAEYNPADGCAYVYGFNFAEGEVADAIVCHKLEISIK